MTNKLKLFAANLAWFLMTIGMMFFSLIILQFIAQFNFLLGLGIWLSIMGAFGWTAIEKTNIWKAIK